MPGVVKYNVSFQLQLHLSNTAVATFPDVQLAGAATPYYGECSKWGWGASDNLISKIGEDWQAPPEDSGSFGSCLCDGDVH